MSNARNGLFRPSVVLRPLEFAIRKQPFIREIRQSPESRIPFQRLIELNVIIQRAGPPVRHPLRRLRAIPRDNLLGQIDEGAQARSHVAASRIIEAISGIRGRPLTENFDQLA